jgi:hypothetical protein
MKKNILLFLIFIANFHSTYAQFANPLGLEFAEKPTLSSCSTQEKSVCKIKVRINTPGGSGLLHVSAFLEGYLNYHVHTTLTGGAGQIIEIVFLGNPSTLTERPILVEMYVGSIGSNDRVSSIEDRSPTINNTLNSELVVMASNSFISNFTPSLVIASTSSFELTYNNPFYVNLSKSKDIVKYTVAVRQNNSGITNSQEYGLNLSPMNVDVSTQQIQSMFNYLYFNSSNKRLEYTVFIHARDCQGNIVDTKNFNVYYTGRQLFEQAPDLVRW